MLGILVPEKDGAICTGRGKGAVGGMERDGIDGVNVIVGSVTLERKVVGLILIFNVLDSDTTFDAANSVTQIGQGGETSNNTGLMLERGRDLLVDDSGIVEIVNKNVSFGGGHHHETAKHVDGVDTFRHGKSGDGNGRRLSSIPELDSFVE